ncbi:DUF6382 domain-containing protein [Paraliobacillus sediminis]|uniref:DUF6382 domain-containing protein n=1 Tax=Paraliobacillus sediminis TaxID=1885916 RepID=UPI000E3BE336|nr:DUF6382 domain-containing protein [Paraliobacillus sediminis]
MRPTISNLNYDFTQQNGHFMIISREGNPLTSDDLAAIQVNMLKSNEIEKVLPIEVEEIDFHVKLYYEITAKKILSQVLREKKLSMQEFYQLLYQIVAAIDASMEYMLEEQNFILDEDFIFIEKDFQDIHLTYLPLSQVSGKPELRDEFKDLFFKLVGHVNELTGSGVQQLTNYINDPSFNVHALKKKLNTLRNQSNTAAPVVDKVEYRPNPISEKKPVQPQSVSKPVAIKPKKQVEAKETKTQTETEEKKGPSKVIVICLAIFGLAIVWKLYQALASEAMLYISVGLSVFVAAASYYFMFVYKSSGSKEAKTDKSKPVKEKKQKTKKNQKGDNVKEGISPKEIDEVDDVQQQVSATTDGKTYFQELQHQTTLLSQPDQTVLLDESTPPQKDGAFFEINRNGKTEKIFFNQSPFLIGRDAATVHYMEDAVGVSRTHIEINQAEEAFTIKDLGSKNGSKHNGEAMVAYKVYQLTDGDQITIGKVTYIFRKG